MKLSKWQTTYDADEAIESLREELAPHITAIEKELLMSHNSDEANDAVKALVAFRDGES